MGWPVPPAVSSNRREAQAQDYHHYSNKTADFSARLPLPLQQAALHAMSKHARSIGSNGEANAVD
jgi:hypothetical protein